MIDALTELEKLASFCTHTGFTVPNTPDSFSALTRLAMEHPSEEARKKYLHDHPNADRSNHTVSKGGKPEKKDTTPKGGMPPKQVVEHLKENNPGNMPSWTAVQNAIEKGKAPNPDKLQKLIKEMESNLDRIPDGTRLSPTTNYSHAQVKKVLEHLKQYKVASMDTLAELEALARFEEGKPADPTDQMSPEDAAEWERMNDKHEDKFKEAAGRTTHLEGKKGFTMCGERAHADTLVESVKDTSCHYCKQAWEKQHSKKAESALPGDVSDPIDQKTSKFEEGKPADPTDNMSEEDAKKWRIEHLKNKDNFTDKSAAENLEAAWTFISASKPNIAPIVNRLKKIKGWHQMTSVSDWNGMEPEDFALELMRVRDDLQDKGFLKDNGIEVDPAEAKDIAKDIQAILDKLPRGKTAATGLYGFTKGVQSDCETCIRKLSKTAESLARTAWEKDENVAPFLQTHAKRANSIPAKILLAAMKSLGPKIAEEVEEDVEEAEDTPAMEKEAAKGGKFGLYGFSGKTSSLGLASATKLREAAGEVAGGLHSRRADKHEHITGFFNAHHKQAKCLYSKLLCASYPDSEHCKKASSVEEWLTWDGSDRTAGFIEDEKWFVFTGNKAFNRDTMDDIRQELVKFKDDEGDEQDSASLKVVRYESSPPMVAAMEKTQQREYVVLVSFPKGALKSAEAALKAVAKKHGFKKVEALSAYRKPENKKI